jgi:CheY-like chemotaxis protein
MTRILVIDDERLLRAPVASVLRHAGYEVDCAGSGEEALQLLESARPDLILLDLMMPGMGGLGFLRRLRADERWAAVPVIVLSAGSDGEQGTEAFKLGARACLLKGTFSLAKLSHFIEVLSAAA